MTTRDWTSLEGRAELRRLLARAAAPPWDLEMLSLGRVEIRCDGDSTLLSLVATLGGGTRNMADAELICAARSALLALLDALEAAEAREARLRTPLPARLARLDKARREGAQACVEAARTAVQSHTEHGVASLADAAQARGDNDGADAVLVAVERAAAEVGTAEHSPAGAKRG